MVKKAILAVSLFIFLAGCCTAVKGTAGAVGGLAEGVKEGAKEDCSAIKKADEWVKENLW